MDEEMVREAAYRGTLRAFSLLCLLFGAAATAFAVFAAALSGSGVPFLGALFLLGMGGLLRVLSKPLADRATRTDVERANRLV